MRAPFAVLTFLLLPGVVAGDDTKPAGQSKEKQAAQAKDRSKTASGKVYTDEDLKKARENPSSNVTVIGTPDASPSPSPESQEGEAAAPAAPSDRDLDEATWKVMAREAWRSVRAAEGRIRELEARIQELLLGDRNPNPTDLLDPARLQKREAARVDAEKKLAEARIQLAAAQQGVEGLQERARAAAVPQSWVEEPAPEPEPQD